MTTLQADPTAVWTSVLDAFDAALDAQEAALDAAHDATPTPFRPPAQMPPIPPALLSRARRAIRRNDDLLDRAQALSDELPPPATAPQRRGAFTPARRSAFDQRG